MNFPWQRKGQIKEEIDSHLEMAKRDLLDRGTSLRQARQAAQREFGNPALVEQVTRDQWGWVWLEEFFQDLRYGARTLRKNRSFTAVAVLTLALGIGANTSLFSVVNAVVLNPLPYPHPEQLVTLHESKPNFENGSISYPNFRDWQEENHTFSGMAISRSTSFTLTGQDEAEQVRARYISSDFFSVLGVNPVIGRTFAPGEDEIGAAPIAIISAGLWTRKFGGSPEVLGKTLTLDGKDYTIVGVTPAAFDLYLQRAWLREVYVPIGQWNLPILNDRSAGLGIHGVGRLKPGVTIKQARADMESISRGLAAAYPKEDKGITASIVELRKDMLGNAEPILLVLFGAVVFVLLIACVNVANLLLARSTSRTREFAIRSALGAGKGRLIRQLLTESMLLALAGGAIGLALAQWATQAALRLVPSELPRAAEIKIDSHVLFFTIGISLLAGIFFGLAPAFKTSQPRLQETLKEGGRGLSSTRHRAQGILVIAEMAMALVLLIGAGLMIRCLVKLGSVDPGFRPDNVLTFGLAFPPSMMTATPDAIRAYVRDIDNTLAATPGVEAVAQSWGAVPLGNEDDQLFWLDGEPKPTNENDMKWTLDYIVGPGYLKVMDIPLRRGRFFSVHDDEHAQRVAVVDEVFARKYFGNKDPLGKRIVMNSVDVNTAGTKFEIIGVVGHVHQWGLDSDETHPLRAQLYLPCLQMPDKYMSTVPSGGGTFVMARGDGKATLLDSVRRATRQMNREQVVYNPETMDHIVADTLAARRFSMILLGIFAGLALLLSTVGIYGVISYLVGQRTQEIGIRVALGARRADILGLVLNRGMKMALIGVGLGLVASLGLTRLIVDMLYDVSPEDPLTFVGVALILTLVALAACYLPARRAMRVDPIVALRYE